MEEDNQTRGARREAKSRKRRKMRVIGRSVNVLQEIIMRLAKKKRDV